MVQDSFNEQNYSSHITNGKRKFIENTYIEILKLCGYFIESYVSRFGDVLKEKLPGIELRNVGKKLTLYF